MVESIKRGFPQREIADAAFRYQREVDSGERVIVGVNAFQLEDEGGTELHRADPAVERRQSARLEATKASRDSAAVERTLGELKTAAAKEANLMPNFLDCARARASEGEMVASLQEVFGTFTEQPVF